MKASTRQALLIGLVILGIWFFETMRPVGQPPGVLAPDPPQVTTAGEKPAIFERNGHVLTTLARFDAKARVLSVERYGRDRQARIAPMDIAIGWGTLSDTATFRGVDVAQTERRLVFKSYDPKLPDQRVAEQVVNLHVIGADAAIEKELAQLRQGNIIDVEGALVEAVSGDGWRWRGEPRSSAPEMPGTLLWVQRLKAQ